LNTADSLVYLTTLHGYTSPTVMDGFHFSLNVG